MLSSRLFLLLFSVLLFSACKTDNYSYAIKDFRKSLQPFLTLIVSKSNVEGYDSSIRFMTTNNELNQLTKSEHPVLRSYAFRELLHRQPSNHFNILMNHLDDTAIVAIHTHWGIKYKTISDDIIENATLKNNEDSNKFIKEVITKHNSLGFAYWYVQQIEPKEQYYLNIKDMATREIKTVIGTSEPYNSYLEFALFALAKFKKKENIKIIKELLLKNIYNLNETSFYLMEEFTDTAYLEVYEKFYPIYYNQAICRYSRSDLVISFINSIAVYKNERSTKILATILNKKPFIKCTTDSSNIKEKLIYAIWDNDCEAYLTLRKQTKEKGQEYEQMKKNVRDGRKNNQL